MFPADPNRAYTPRKNVPVFTIVEGDLFENGKPFEGTREQMATRIGCGVMNFTRSCRCGKCDSCLIGKAYLAR